MRTMGDDYSEGTASAASPYDRIAAFYDSWSRSVTEDVDFYVAEAKKASGAAGVEAGAPVVELGVGTGRIAVPIAAAGVPVIGVDSSAGMLEICRERAESAGVGRLLDLRLGDLLEPPVTERVPLVTCPFRAYLHLPTDADRRTALRAAHALLLPGGRLVFDVFSPGAGRHRGDPWALARARAGYLGACGLGRAGAPADPLRAREER